MLALGSITVARPNQPRETDVYTPLQHYLLKRVTDLRQQQRELPMGFRDHPIGRLNAAALQATLEECEWAGVSREAGAILRCNRRSASAS
jgi:hypothetical protein